MLPARTPAVLLVVALAAAVPLADLLFAQPPAAPGKGRKVALLIGVNQYANRKLDPLNFAEADVADLDRVLAAAGFEVKTIRGSAGIDPKANQSGKDVYFAALAATLKGVTRSDTVLLGFSGHGVQLIVKEPGPDGKPVDKESPYFCPADGIPSDPTTLIGINEVLKVLDERGGGHNLLLVDACRNVVDPLRSARGGINGSRIDNLPEGTAVFFSCSGRQRAMESAKAGGGHGVFFHFVLEGLKGASGATDSKGRVTWDRLVPFVKEQVKEAGSDWLADLPVGERQVPFAIGSLGDVPPLVTGDLAKQPPGGNLELREKSEPFDYVIEGVTKKGTRRVVTLDIGGGEKMEFVRIPKGTFMMGALAGEKDAGLNEKPQRRVEITREFYLGKFEVTQAQYKAVTGADPSEFKGGRLPVETVTWDDATSFCSTLSGRVKRKVELPTEAEWEYACRAGTTTPFHFGSKLNGDLANCDGNYPYGTEVKGAYKKTTVEVGSYPANPWGLHDMHGNVWEWCRDYYGPYDMIASLKDPFQSKKQSNGHRVLRGGCWDEVARNCRAANRVFFLPGFRGNSYFGFRVCFRLD